MIYSERKHLGKKMHDSGYGGYRYFSSCVQITYLRTYLLTYLLTLFLYCQVHKAERRALHPVRFLAFSFKSIPEMLPFCMSRCTVCLRVILVCPRFLFPVGIHVHACGGILFSSVLRACPRYRHLLLLIVFVRSSSSRPSRTTSLEV